MDKLDAYDKELRKLTKRDQVRIEEKILTLASDPRPEDSIKLKTGRTPPLYRIRSGNYRIIYTIQDGILFVLPIDFFRVD